MGGFSMPGRSPTAVFIEEMALSLELFGWPRMAGRILAYLLICTPEHQTQQSLAAALGASKASVSTMLNLLQQADSVAKVPMPGGRRDYYYRLKDDAWFSLAARQLRLHKRLADVAARGVVSLDLGEAGGKRLRDFAKCQRRCFEEVAKGLADWADAHEKTK
jgi:DNA-binding transcriptional regulator GbsR (MarR family)